MSDVQNLIGKAKSGFQTLDISEKYANIALNQLETWLSDAAFQDYKVQLEYLIDAEKWEFLLDSFYQIIPFGTGGRRGPVGIGTNRINFWTIQSSAQGHSQYLIKHHGEAARERGLVIAYDVRKYLQKGVYDDNQPNPVRDLDCKMLAIAAAEVYGANGIKVFIYEDVRSTPQLSYSIRHLNAISGIMVSASHNPPTDNGKKVYDDNGGQLIPPDDQNLVEEVTQNVTEIKTRPFDELQKEGLVQFVGKEIDESYVNAVSGVSLSAERGANIMYSPLHGCGLTSVYPVLQHLGFNVKLDPKTSNMSGAFENVIFNIPNPEVIESFATAIDAANNDDIDIIINSDPDADRLGVMVNHNKDWHFLNGNEIGIVLTNYSISKFKAKDRLQDDSVIIKTVVTTSLIEEIALRNGLRCISDLLVGLKYVAHEMNQLNSADNISSFVLGLEESHGYVTGIYCRDKDAAGAAVWISEMAAELKKEDKTLIDYLDQSYADYGYCHNSQAEIRLLGAKGMEQISALMEHFRTNDIDAFGDFQVSEKIDRWQGEPQPHLSPTDTSARNVLIFNIKPQSNTHSMKITVRPSGTEPKLKIYFEVFGNPVDLSQLTEEKERIADISKQLDMLFTGACYKILEPQKEFPKRGFLLFGQLPFYDKLKYFDLEDDIVALKDISDREERTAKLDELLAFLGANPVQKVDKAFIEKYGTGIRSYLDI